MSACVAGSGFILDRERQLPCSCSAWRARGPTRGVTDLERAAAADVCRWWPGEVDFNLPERRQQYQRRYALRREWTGSEVIRPDFEPVGANSGQPGRETRRQHESS